MYHTSGSYGPDHSIDKIIPSVESSMSWNCGLKSLKKMPENKVGVQWNQNQAQQKHASTLQGVPNGWERVPLSNPLGFKHHPLEGPGVCFWSWLIMKKSAIIFFSACLIYCCQSVRGWVVSDVLWGVSGNKIMIKKPSPDRMLHISMETVKGEGLSMEKVGIAQQKTHGNLRVPPPHSQLFKKSRDYWSPWITWWGLIQAYFFRYRWHFSMIKLICMCFFLVCFVVPGSQEEPKRIDVSSQRAVLEKAGFVYPIGFM